MPKYIVEMPKDYEPGHYSSCPFHCDYCRQNAECTETCPLASAKPAKTMTPFDIMNVSGQMAMTKSGQLKTWAAMDGKKYSIFAVEEE